MLPEIEEIAIVYVHTYAHIYHLPPIIPPHRYGSIICSYDSKYISNGKKWLKFDEKHLRIWIMDSYIIYSDYWRNYNVVKTSIKFRFYHQPYLSQLIKHLKSKIFMISPNYCAGAINTYFIMHDVRFDLYLPNISSVKYIEMIKAELNAREFLNVEDRPPDPKYRWRKPSYMTIDNTHIVRKPHPRKAWVGVHEWDGFKM